MNTKRKSIAIDMDGVIADTVAQFITWHHRENNGVISREDFIGKNEADVLPGGVLRKFVFSEGFFRTVPLMDGAREAVLELMKRFDVYIVSAAMEFPQSLPEKYEWLQEHFPFITWHNIIFCGDKSVIGTDYMIDDHVKNLDCCRGKAIMFTAGHNSGVDHHFRANNWKEVIAFFDTEVV